MGTTPLRKALVEGRLLYRGRHKIYHWFGLLEEKLDFFIGKQIRKIFIKKVPIVENKVVFCSFQGDFTDNPKYIAQELIKQHAGCKLIWIGRQKTKEHPETVPKEFSDVFEWWTYDAYHALASAKVLVINSVELFKRPYKKKEGQYIIETWHGSLGIKRFDRNANSGKSWVKAADYCNKVCDYLISNSKFENDIYRNSYWPKTEILEYGHPRNDCLIISSGNERTRLRNKIFKYAKLKDTGQHIVLYAPTFRDAKNFDCYSLNADRLTKALSTRFGGKWLAFYRYHPTVRAESVKNAKKIGKTIDVTNYPDMQELLQIADVGITDYSSWIYDFVLTDRPGFIFATDIDKYNNERGFAYPLEQTPFDLSTDNVQIINFIENFDYDKYLEKRKSFLEEKGCIEDGHASERAARLIINLTRENQEDFVPLKIEDESFTDTERKSSMIRQSECLKKELECDDEKIWSETFDTIYYGTSTADSKAYLMSVIEYLAEKNIISALWRLGRAYREGYGTGRNLEKSRLYIERSLIRNDPIVYNEYFTTLSRMDTTEAYDQLPSVIEKLKEFNDPLSLGNIGRAYLKGNGVSKDNIVAADYFARAGDLGIKWGYNDVVDSLWEVEPQLALKKIIDIVISFINESNRQNILKYLEFNSNIDDEELSERFIEKYSRIRPELVKNKMIDLLYLINSEKSDQMMFNLAFTNARKDNTLAMKQLGQAYMFGRGTEIDLDNAAKWTRRAKNEKVPGSDIQLFDILWMMNTDKSNTELKNLISKMKENYNSESYIRISKAYFEGRGVKQNEDLAKEWEIKSKEISVHPY